MSIKDLSPEIQAAGAALLKAWQGRSSEEQSNFAQTLGAASHMKAAAMPGSAGDGDAPLEGALEKAERIAAVSGGLNPAALVKDASMQAASMVLDQLAPSFDRAWTADAWSWTLKSERRAAVLRSIPRSELAGVLDAASRVLTDTAGTVLRQLLSPAPQPTAAAPLGPNILAHEWAVAVKPDLKEELDALRKESVQYEALRAFDNLLKDDFFGRTAELDRLREFMEQPDGVEEARGAIPVLPVSGIGGSGKSTLLAKALRPMMQQAFASNAAPMVVSMDFDRRTLLAGAELELSFELSRQLGRYFPKIEPRLTQLRDEVSLQRAQRGELDKNQYDASAESSSRHGNEFDYMAGPLLHQAGVHERRLILVLDTFEEWQREQHQRGSQNSAVRRVLDWLVTLKDIWQLRLRVIVSGRAPFPDGIGLAAVSRPIQLGELKRAESVELLRKQGMPVTAARSVARMAGGIPLALKLAARYYLLLPDDRRVAFVKDASAELQGVDAALRLGLLYKRFLDHIADPRARRLAHPGLALRRVSPALIREVLAQPCGLEVPDTKTADELFELLAREVWLVEQMTPDLVHRPELRKAMLHAMRADPEKAAQLQAVHAAAAAWYARLPKPSQQDLAEGLYHRLSVATGQQVGQLLAGADPMALQDVAQSAEDFTPAIRAQLLDQVGGRLSVAEAAQLPQPRRLAWASGQADELVRIGQPDRALDLWAQLGDAHPSGSWYAAACFQAQQWDNAQVLLNMNPGEGQLRYAYLMSFIVERREPEMARQLRERLDERLERRMRTYSREIAGAVVLEDGYFAAVAGRQPTVPKPDPDLASKWVQEAQPGATTYLRIRALLPRSAQVRRRGPALRRLLASAFQPTRDFLSDIIHALRDAGSNAAMTRNFHRELAAALKGGLRSAQVLGAWSDRFSRCVEEDLRTVPDDEVEDIVDCLASDDPEWRFPIRAALAQVGRSSFGMRWRVELLRQVLTGWTPVDLRTDVLLPACERNPQAAWKKVIEYVDRCGMLPELMAGMKLDGDERVRKAASNYLRWKDRRDKFESRRKS